MRSSSLSRVTGLLTLLALGLTACGGEPTPDAPTIAAFTAEPGSVEVGGTVALSWQTTHATAVSLTDDEGTAIALDGAAPAEGSVTVTLDVVGDHVFHLTATGAEGTLPAEATVTASATAPPAPTVVHFAADPAGVATGESAVLSWETEDAVRVVVQAADTVLSDEAAASGQVTVTPAVDTTYTLTATGRGGDETVATAQVVVYPEPLVDLFEVRDLDGNPLAIDIVGGESVVLAWETSHADAVSLVDADGTVLAAEAVDGSVTVVPPWSTEYTLTATGPGGTASATVQVGVLAAVEALTLSAEGEAPASALTVRKGDQVTLSWVTHGATGGSFSWAPTGAAGAHAGPEGPLAAAEVASGSVTFPAEAAGTYTLALDPFGMFAEASVEIALTDAPRIRSVQATPNPASTGETVALSWVEDGAESLTITATHPDPEVPAVAASDVDLTTGTASLTLDVSGLWEVVFEATNALAPAAPHRRTLVLDVRAAPEILAFQARPTRTVSGGSVQLSWEATDADQVTLLKDGAPVTGFPSGAQGTFTDTVVADAAYQLLVDNGLGIVTPSEVVQVTVGDPEIVAFSASQDYLAPGDALTLSWENLGGRSVQVLDLTAGTAVNACALVDAFDQIEAGGCSFEVPAELGERTYRLVVADGAREATRELTVAVVDGPVIRSFTAAERITEGATLTFTAEIDPALDGAAPELSLTDSYGISYDVLTWDEQTGLAEGSLTLSNARDYHFTLTASSPDATPSRAEHLVTVVAAPVIEQFLAQEPYLDTQDGPFATNLRWTTRNVSRLVLRVAGAILWETEDPAQIAEHLYEVSPDATLEYQLEAYNGAGGVDSARVRIGVDYPYFTRLDATNFLGDGDLTVHTLVDDANDATTGDLATLHWEAVRTEKVFVGPLNPTVTEGTGVLAEKTDPALTDVTVLAIAGAEEVQGVSLPFAVPFYGLLEDQLVVSTSGWVSFNEKEGPTDSYGSLPSSSRPDALIAPYFAAIEANPLDGEIWTAQGADPDRGAFFLVQWRGFQFESSYRGAANFNFQVKLYASGDIEITYGEMYTEKSSYPVGKYAAVGVQNQDHTVGLTYINSTAFEATGLSLLLQFPAGLPVDQMAFASDKVEKTYTVTALGTNGGATTQTITHVTWSDLATADDVLFNLGPAEVGSPMEARWQVADATRVALLVDGVQVCERLTERNNRSGCTWTPEAEGSYEVTLAYENPVSSGQIVRTVEVATRLAIDSFLVDGAASIRVPEGQPVVLTWSVTGEVVELLLLDARRDLDLTQTCLDQGTPGTCTLTPPGTTRYQLFVSDSAGWADPDRTRYAAVEVAVADTAVDAMSISRSQTWQGGEVQVDWAATATAGDAQVTVNPPISTRAGVPFESLGVEGEFHHTVSEDVTDPLMDAIDLSSAGFTFPFGGTIVDYFEVSPYGYVNLGYRDDQYNELLRQDAPDTLPFADGHEGIIAPFWPESRHRPYPYPERLWRLEPGQPGQQALVIEWEAVHSFLDGSAQVQLALFDDGRMEFRYGTFELDPTFSSDLEGIQGEGILVGWENFDATDGLALVAKQYRPDLLAEGVVHTLYPLSAAHQGSRTYVVQDDTEFEVCATGDGVTDCRAESILVVKPGDVLITEMMIDPSPMADDQGEWVELRNTTGHAIDLQGWVLSDGVGSYTFPAGEPLLLEGGAYLVVARGGNQAVDTPYVWTDPDLDLDDVTDGLTLTYGPMVVDSVIWTPEGKWDIVPGRSVTLDASVIREGEAANDHWVEVTDGGGLDQRWCVSSGDEPMGDSLYGSPGATGHGCRFPSYDLDPRAGQTVQFLDIRDTGLALPLSEGNQFTQVPGGLGFTVPYFGRDRSELYVSSNGWLSLEAQPQIDTNAFPFNREIPFYTTTWGSPSVTGVIAPFWDGLAPNLDAVGGITSSVHAQTLGASPNRVTVVQWTDWNLSSYSGEPSASLTFQAQIHENGDIVFAYDRMELRQYQWDWMDRIRGSSATIGIEHPNDQAGIEFSYDSDYAVEPNQVLWFRKK